MQRLAERLVPKSRVVELSVPDYDYPFAVRWPGSDIHIAHSILASGEYGEFTRLIDKSASIIILDIGANIGAASAFFLKSFPNARVIAVEPDRGNAQICARNLRAYGERATVKNVALWSRTTELAFETGTLGTGNEAGVRVRDAQPGDKNTVKALDVPTMLREVGIDLKSSPVIAMKIDAEGSEREIFRDNIQWLQYVGWIAIELHDYLPGAEGCSERFFGAIAPYVEKRIDRPDTTFVQLRSRASSARV